MLCQVMNFGFASAVMFLPHAGMLPRALGRGVRRRPPCTQASNLGLRGACSGRSKQRNLANTRGLCFRRLESVRPTTFSVNILCLLCCWPVLLYHDRTHCPMELPTTLCGCDGPPTVAHQALSVATATDSAYRIRRNITLFQVPLPPQS